MKSYHCAVLFAACAGAQQLSMDGVPAAGLHLGSGLTIADRAALRGVSTVDVVCPDSSGPHRALIVGEDRDAGLILLWSSCAQPAPPDPVVLIPGMKVRTAAHESRVTKVLDSASFGFVFPLHTEKTHPKSGAPLLDSEARPAGWYAPRMIDGQLLTFALPAERLRALRRDRWQTPAEWNAAYQPEFEDAYQRAIAYLWIEDFESAAFYLDKATRLHPRDARAWFHFAFVEGKRGRSAPRIDYYRKAVALDPALAEAHYNLGVVLIMGARAEEAHPHVAALHQLLSPLAERLEGLLEAAHADPLPDRKH